jgi:hypothetical protein
MSQHDTLLSNFLAQQESCNSALEAIGKAATATVSVQSEAYHLAIEAINDATALAQSSNSAFHAIADGAAFAHRELLESIDGASISIASISAPHVDASIVQSAIQAHNDILAAVSDGICQIDAETSRIWQECIGSSYPEPYAVSLALSNEWDLTIPGVPNVGTELALIAAQYRKADLVALERDLKAACDANIVLPTINFKNELTEFDAHGCTIELLLRLCRVANRTRYACKLNSALAHILGVVRFLLRSAFAGPQPPEFDLCGVLETYRSFFELHGMGRPPCLGWAC